MTETWLLPMLRVQIAIGIGYAVGKMPCWESRQGYVGLIIVVPVAIAAGIPTVEVFVDS